MNSTRPAKKKETKASSLQRTMEGFKEGAQTIRWEKPTTTTTVIIKTTTNIIIMAQRRKGTKIEIIKGIIETCKQGQIMSPRFKFARTVERPTRESVSGECLIATHVSKADIFPRIVLHRTQHRWDNFSCEHLNSLQAAIDGSLISQGWLEARTTQAQIYAYTNTDALASTSNVAAG